MGILNFREELFKAIVRASSTRKKSDIDLSCVGGLKKLSPSLQRIPFICNNTPLVVSFPLTLVGSVFGHFIYATLTKALCASVRMIEVVRSVVWMVYTGLPEHLSLTTDSRKDGEERESVNKETFSWPGRLSSTTPPHRRRYGSRTDAEKRDESENE